MSEMALNDYLSLPICPTCDGYGEEPYEVLYGNTVATNAVPCSRRGGLGRIQPAAADMLAAQSYADARYEVEPL